MKLTKKTGGKSLSHLFLREKPVQMLVKLNKKKGKQKYFSVIAKEVDCTYSHTVRTLQELNRKGLLTFKKTGRKNIIQLTKLGKDMAETFDKILTLFSFAVLTE